MATSKIQPETQEEAIALNKTVMPSTKESWDKGIQQEKESLEILKNPNLLDIIVKEIQDKKVVGEKETIETIFLIMNCRKVKNIKSTSTNLLVNDETGLGKDHIVKSIIEILPKEETISRTKITPELFTYWHNPKFEPEWTWDGKVFYLEDISSHIINSDVFKVFSSGGSKATVLIKQTPVDIEIRGKPAMIVTSYEANPNYENLRRYPICFLDSSEEQTYNIMMRQSIEDMTGETIEYDQKITEAIRKLNRVKVKIPFADKIPSFFPKNHFMRTHYKRFLDYIKSVACLYQFQREKDAEGNIIATGEDYNIARKILLKTTSNPSMIPLTREQKNVLNFFEKHNGEWFSIGDIEDKFPVSERTLQRWIKNLFRYKFLKADSQKRDESKKPVPVYSFSGNVKIEIPEWNNVVSFKSSLSCVSSVSLLSSNNPTDNQRDKGLNDKGDINDMVFNDTKPLNIKIKELKKYCNDLKKKGLSNTLDNLHFNFEPNFISHCIESGLLIKLPKGNYDFVGGDHE